MWNLESQIDTVQHDEDIELTETDLQGVVGGRSKEDDEPVTD